MDKKILLGSIIAVGILVLVSFSGVVGYQTTSSTIAKASPLFSIRTSRAIKQDQDILTSDYISKDKVRTLLFPDRDNRQGLFQKVINRISKMDEKKFNRLAKVAVSRLHKENKLRDRDIDEALVALHQLQNEKNLLSKLDIDMTGNTPWTEYPICTIACTIDHWIPTCAIEEILITLVGIMLSIYCFFIGTGGPPGQ